MDRGITPDAIRDVVEYPNRRRYQYAGDHGGYVFRFSKLRHGFKLVVVAEVKDQECWLITCFYE